MTKQLLRGISRFNIELPTSIIVRLLNDKAHSSFQPPASNLTPKEDRNTDILRLREQGYTIAELAARFDISPQRIHQIIHGKRK